METPQKEHVTLDRIEEAHSYFTKQSAETGADHTTLGFKHREYRQGQNEECYICTLLLRTAAAERENQELKAKIEDAYLAGFNRSGEGYNGECPFQDNDRNPEDDPDWVQMRDLEIAALGKE